MVKFKQLFHIKIDLRKHKMEDTKHMSFLEEFFRVEERSFSKYREFTYVTDRVREFILEELHPEEDTFEMESDEFFVTACRQNHNITISHLYDVPEKTETISFDAFLAKLDEIKMEIRQV